MRSMPIFAAEQTEDFIPPPPPKPDPVITHQRADTLIAATKAGIIHEGARAYYDAARDRIHLPPRDLFVGTTTSSPTESYYATAFHELTHWTGHESRCGRQLGKRFGPKAYAMEELVAELGAAFLCAELEIAGSPRPDHAHYVASWLEVLSQDKRAIFTAASKASEAAAFLRSIGEAPDRDCPVSAASVGLEASEHAEAS